MESSEKREGRSRRAVRERQARQARREARMAVLARRPRRRRWIPWVFAMVGVAVIALGSIMYNAGFGTRCYRDPCARINSAEAQYTSGQSVDQLEQGIGYYVQMQLFSRAEGGVQARVLLDQRGVAEEEVDAGEVQATIGFVVPPDLTPGRHVLALEVWNPSGEKKLAGKSLGSYEVEGPPKRQ